MAKIRHIAYRAANVEVMANFFVHAFGMTVTQRRPNNAIDLSDGAINITVLPIGIPASGGEMPRPGIEHIGFTVEDEAATGERLQAEGAKKIATITLGSPAHYEAKYRGPEGIIVDIGKWVGTAPISEKK